MNSLNIALIIFLNVFSQFIIAQTNKNVDSLIAPALIHEQPITERIPLLLSVRNTDLLNNDPLKMELNYPVLGAVGGVFLGGGITVHIYQRNAWWSDNRRSFHIQHDWEYALWADKIGHIYAGALLSHLFSAGLEAGNLDYERSAIYGSALALAFHTYVEIEDGFGEEWGFSPGDAIANLLGAGFALAQYYYPSLKNIQPRFSYVPSQKMRDGTHQGNGIDDYEGQIYWFSFRMKNILPEGIAKYWPSFLMLSAGMGVRDLDGSGGGKQEFYIGLDFDAEVIPLYGKFWQFVKNTLNYFHFPMPGIRITPDAAFFVFLF